MAAPQPSKQNVISPDIDRSMKTRIAFFSKPAFTSCCTVLALLATALSAQTASPGHPPLRVGMELAYPPFEMLTPDGQPAGVSVDLARALAEYLGREVQIENMPFDGLIPALRTGKIDLVISSMTATPERARAIDFSQPYLSTGLGILAGTNAPIERIEDLNAPGRTVAVKKGTTGHLYAMDNLPKANLLVLDKENACVLEVVQGKADAFLYDQMSVYKHASLNPETTRALLKPFREEAWAVGLAHGSGELRERVNAFIETFRTAGGFEKLGDKYLAEQKAAFKAQNIPFVF